MDKNAADDRSDKDFATHAQQKTRFRHFIRGALIVGIILHVVVFLFIKVSPLDREYQPSSEAFVQFPQETADFRSRVLRERMLLFDPEPLFLPTRWNYAGNFNDVLKQRGELSVFMPYQPIFSSVEGLLAGANQEMEGVAAIDPRSSLAPERWDFFSKYGETAVGAPVAQRSGSVMRVVNLFSGEVVVNTPLELPSMIRQEGRLLRPQNFVITVTSTGPVGLPLRIRSTGNDVLDEELGRTVANAIRRVALRPGEYRVVVGE